MNNLKKLTEYDYRQLNSTREILFDNTEGGELNPLKYEILGFMVNELKEQDYDVSEFEDFLEEYKEVYKIRKEGVS